MPSIIRATTTSGLQVAPDNSGSLQLQTNGTTTAVTIDTSQNVGIGTSSPSAKLHVSGVSSGNSNIRLTNTFTNGRSWELNPYAAGVSDVPFTIRDVTAGADRVTIDSSGNVLVGVTSPGSWAGSSAIAATGYVVRSGRTGSFANNVFNINWTGSAQLWIDTTNIGTIAFTSDYRIKKNIETSTTPALERIAQIRPVTYEFANYKELFKEDGVAREGFIAHELAEVIPSAVDGEKDAENQIQSLKLDALCSVMVKAIQEQQTIINDLKDRIETLEAK